MNKTTKIVCAIQLLDKIGNASFIGPFGDDSSINDKKDLEEANEYIMSKGLKAATACFVRGSTQMEKVV